MKVTLKSLREQVKIGDNGGAHAIADGLIYERLKKLDPEYYKKIDDIVGELQFYFS